jgi:LysR family transcriptional regulator, low CO2-responsive transcriptional regulator
MISASPRRLSVFKSVVDLGGFNAAASELGIAQPSVGAHIRALESQIGQPLFQRRRGSRPKLTKAGEALYSFAVDLLRKTEETAHVLDDIRKIDAHQLAIAVHRDLMSAGYSAWLATFAKKHPKARVVTRIGTIEDVIALVREREVNLGLFLASGPVDGIRSDVLSHEPLLLAVSPQHPLARRVRIAPDEVVQHPFVSGLRGSHYVEWVDAALRGVGITSYDVAMELQESTAVKEMVRHGAGIACLPACTVRAEIAAGSLVALKLATDLPALEIRYGHVAPLSGVAKQFVEAIGAR